MPTMSGGNVMPGSRSRAARPTAIFEYDFAIDGGGIGTISLRPIGGSPLPSGAIITDSIVEVLTIPTSGGAATIAVTAEAANDIVAAAAISGAPWSSLGRKAGVPVSAATSVKTTAVRTPAAVVAVAALTAGKFRVSLEYIDPNVG